jgi:hypothetical protein
MVPVTVQLQEKLSERWKSLSTLNTAVPSVERMRKLSLDRTILFYLLVVLVVCSVKRQATGIWKCLRCKKVMAGGAYVLSTSAAITARTAVARLRKTAKADSA